MKPLPLPQPRPAAALGALALAVGLLHLVVANWLGEQAAQLGEGAADRGPARLTAVFSVDLQPAAPPAVAVVAGAPVAPAAPRVRAPAPAASVPSATPSDPAPPVEEPPGAQAPQTPPTLPTPQGPDSTAAASSPALAASGALPVAAMPPAMPALPASASASVVAFEWPRSTRLSYRLSGHYRGPVEGQARVQWLREGTRYQVHLDVGVGPAFAPLVSRRMTSDGDIGPQGLQPRRYDEETKVALRDARRLTMHFDGQRVRLANGSEVPQPAGVQDTASQFVQLTWLFTTRPDLLQPGQSVPLMLALPRRVDDWVYDVVGTERLYTPAGEIDAVHVRPRRPARAGDLTAEMWVAPSLQYLPVRFIIRQDAETFVDLLLDRLPQQAADAADAADAANSTPPR